MSEIDISSVVVSDTAILDFLQKRGAVVICGVWVVPNEAGADYPAGFSKSANLREAVRAAIRAETRGARKAPSPPTRRPKRRASNG